VKVKKLRSLDYGFAADLKHELDTKTRTRREKYTAAIPCMQGQIDGATNPGSGELETANK
jgi:hypothetical protein